MNSTVILSFSTCSLRSDGKSTTFYREIRGQSYYSFSTGKFKYNFLHIGYARHLEFFDKEILRYQHFLIGNHCLNYSKFCALKIDLFFYKKNIITPGQFPKECDPRIYYTSGLSIYYTLYYTPYILYSGSESELYAHMTE